MLKKTYAQTVALSQVSAHNTETDCWVIISGKVYNITNYLSSHSGGAAAIVPYCGTDATQGFAGKPHPASDINALAAYYVGDLAVDATPFPSPSPSPASTPVLSPSPPSAVPTPSPLVSPSPSPSPVFTPVSKSVHKDDEDDEDIDDNDDDEDNDLSENENKITKNIIKQYEDEEEDD